MVAESNSPLLIADIGNSTIDLALFQFPVSWQAGIPQPIRTGKFSVADLDLGELRSWLAAEPFVRCHIGSVNDKPRRQLCELLTGFVPQKSIVSVRHENYDMPMRVEEPAAVGIDRYAGAVAANRLRRPDRPAIVISSGSAITFNVVSAEGAFLGGMIAPGMHLSVHTLSAKTDQLPLVSTKIDGPPLIGNNTVGAIQSGVFWMTVGGIDGVLARLQEDLASECDLFGAGGSFPDLLSFLQHDVRFEPHLVLAGLALAES